MIFHRELSDHELKKEIRSGEICFGGNRKLKIFGTLQCKAGRRMKKENRVFFRSAHEAIKEGFRPCGYCLKETYKNWKSGLV